MGSTDWLPAVSVREVPAAGVASTCLRAQPVVLRGIAASWDACRTWSWRTLADTVGDHEVDVEVWRKEITPQEFTNDMRHLRLTVNDVCDATARTRAHGPLLYLTQVTLTGGLQPLRSDVPGTRELLHTIQVPAGSRWGQAYDPMLFVGPAGTITHLHYDVQRAILVQIRGRKRVTLLPPAAARMIGARLAGAWGRPAKNAELDVERPDYDRFPAAAGLQAMRCTLYASDGLYIPTGWMHHVRALDAAISLNYGWLSFGDLPWLARHGMRWWASRVRR